MATSQAQNKINFPAKFDLNMSSWLEIIKTQESGPQKSWYKHCEFKYVVSQEFYHSIKQFYTNIREGQSPNNKQILFFYKASSSVYFIPFMHFTLIMSNTSFASILVRSFVLRIDKLYIIGNIGWGSVKLEVGRR